jgi:hypothetical protein
MESIDAHTYEVGVADDYETVTIEEDEESGFNETAGKVESQHLSLLFNAAKFSVSNLSIPDMPKLLLAANKNENEFVFISCS